MPNETLMSFSDLPCCPEITRDPCCDRLQFTYRLENRMTDLPVEIVITAELERCPGPLSLGDVVYSTTLLPGEKVHLYTSSRNTRFTYDSEWQVTYRHEQVSEVLLHDVHGPVHGKRPVWAPSLINPAHN